MSHAYLFIGMLVWLQLKHYVADYLLQPPWILRGKGDLRKPGGYVHAGLHAIGSTPAFIVAGLDFGLIAGMAAVEFVVHYLIDYFKANYSSHRPMSATTMRYWALHGADQLMHHLTYSAMLLVAVNALAR
jgi:hypothetical protein